jgi:inorganic triphosphatase YgiF
MSQEIELKLALGPDGPQALYRHPRLDGLASRVAHLVNTYYDTPKGELAAAGMALRLRRRDDKLLQTLKTRGGGSGGLSTRGEWEWDVPGPGLDLTGLAELSALSELDADVLSRLVPRFTTDFHRRAWQLALDDARIELALDQGEIRAGEQAVGIRELELELKAGEPAALWVLAEALAERVPLRPADTSKAARGGALLEGGWTLPQRGDPGDWLHRAIVALDALADTEDDGWRDQARQAFQRLGELGDDAIHDNAQWLAEALKSNTWLTTGFGRRALYLAHRFEVDTPL